MAVKNLEFGSLPWIYEEERKKKRERPQVVSACAGVKMGKKRAGGVFYTKWNVGPSVPLRIELVGLKSVLSGPRM